MVFGKSIQLKNKEYLRGHGLLPFSYSEKRLLFLIDGIAIKFSECSFSIDPALRPGRFIVLKCLFVCLCVCLWTCPAPYIFSWWMSYSANIPGTPNIFTDSGPPIKWLLGGLVRGAPDPHNPPYGGAEIYLGGLLLMYHFDHNSQIFLWSSWLEISLGLSLGNPPNTLTPYPPRSL